MKKKILMLTLLFGILIANSGCGKKNDEQKSNGSKNKNTYIDIIYLDPTDKNVKCTEADASKNVNKDGTPSGIDSGCMKWYIYAEDSDNYKAILDHNTTTMVEWNELFENESFENSNLKPIIDKLKNKWVVSTSAIIDVGIISAQEIAKITNNTNWTENSELYYFFDTNSQEELKDKTQKSAYAWLYDYTSICEKFGCNVEDNNLYNGYNQIYGYWTITMRPDSNKAWVVYAKGDLGNVEKTAQHYGIRPVITIPKSALN